MSQLLPRRPVPDLSVPTLAGDAWSLVTATPQRFSLITFYRGLHCPICATYVAELEGVAAAG
jgi:peroxiredoxin